MQLEGGKDQFEAKKNREEFNLFRGIILHSPDSVIAVNMLLRGNPPHHYQPHESGQNFCSVVVMASMQIWKKSGINFILL